jgi:hypothetical protein
MHSELFQPHNRKHVERSTMLVLHSCMDVTKRPEGYIDRLIGSILSAMKASESCLVQQ